MGYLMMQVAFTSEGWTNLIQNPGNRFEEVVRPLVEGLGGTAHGGWLSFGEYDVVAIFEMPDEIQEAAVNMAFAASGVKAVKTTPLVT